MVGNHWWVRPIRDTSPLGPNGRHQRRSVGAPTRRGHRTGAGWVAHPRRRVDWIVLARTGVRSHQRVQLASRRRGQGRLPHGSPLQLSQRGHADDLAYTSGGHAGPRRRGTAWMETSTTAVRRGHVAPTADTRATAANSFSYRFNSFRLANNMLTKSFL